MSKQNQAQEKGKVLNLALASFILASRLFHCVIRVLVLVLVLVLALASALVLASLVKTRPA